VVSSLQQLTGCALAGRKLSSHRQAQMPARAMHGLLGWARSAAPTRHSLPGGLGTTVPLSARMFPAEQPVGPAAWTALALFSLSPPGQLTG